MNILKGTLRPLRTVGGIALLLIGGGKLLGVDVINNIVGNHPIVVSLIIVGAGYLLVRQYYKP